MDMCLFFLRFQDKDKKDKKDNNNNNNNNNKDESRNRRVGVGFMIILASCASCWQLPIKLEDFNM